MALGFDELEGKILIPNSIILILRMYNALLIMLS